MKMLLISCMLSYFGGPLSAVHDHTRSGYYDAEDGFLGNHPQLQTILPEEDMKSMYVLSRTPSVSRLVTAPGLGHGVGVQG